MKLFLKQGIKIFVLAAIFTIVTAVNALALHIDFTNEQLFGDAGGQSVFNTTVDDVGLSLHARPEDEDATLTWNKGDGIGIEHSYEYDEIEDDEQLALLFDNTVLLETIYLTDFFVESRGGRAPYAETGTITLFGDGWQQEIDIEAISPTSGTNGEFELGLGDGYFVNQVIFEAAGKQFAGEDHEYSLAGVVVNTDVVPVPEPGTFILLGIGILGGFGIMRKRSR